MIPKSGRRIGFIACFGDAKLYSLLWWPCEKRRGSFTSPPDMWAIRRITAKEELHAF